MNDKQLAQAALDMVTMAGVKCTDEDLAYAVGVRAMLKKIASGEVELVAKEKTND